jgi:cobalt/nickel transport system ATP-binding protein
MTAIQIDTLSFTYGDGTRALDCCSIVINEKEKVGIIGANGAGKSTLVNHLNGYNLPQHGKVLIQNIELTKKSQEKIRMNVGVVFQNADDQLFTARVYDDIAFGPLNMGIQGDALHERIESVLRELDLWDLRERPPSHLSQGQKRFAAFATILAMKPSIIVMDEPTSDLDPRHRRKLINLIKSLDKTCVTVSHDLDFIWDTCDRVLVMAQGKVVADGQCKEMLSNCTLLENNGLELPLRLQK